MATKAQITENSYLEVKYECGIYNGGNIFDSYYSDVRRHLAIETAASSNNMKFDISIPDGVFYPGDIVPITMDTGMSFEDFAENDVIITVNGSYIAAGYSYSNNRNLVAAGNRGGSGGSVNDQCDGS